MESALAYRMRMVLWLLVEVLSVVIMYFIWRAVFMNSGQVSLEGYTLEDMLIYLLSQKFVFSITYNNPLGIVHDDVRSGRIAMSLIKPISYRTSLFFINLGESLVGSLVFALPYIVVIFILKFVAGYALTFSFIQILFFFISILLAILITFLANMIYANIIFYTTAAFGVWQLNQVITRIFSGELIPLVFFPPWLLMVAKFLPFMHVQYVPIQIFMNRLTVPEMINALLTQGMWIGILLVISELIWRQSIKKVAVLGG